MWTRSRMIMCIVWPAFLAACVLELLVFAVVDPNELHWFGLPVSASRLGVYTVAFFVFWMVAAAASGLAVLLAQPSSTASGRDGR